MARSDYTEWLKRADDDLVAMERLVAYGYTPLNVVCYHAQQYAEKIVKAITPAKASRGLFAS